MSAIRCTCCNRVLIQGRQVAWLELDQRIDEYHDFGDIPEATNQGAFPFGIACAIHARAKARNALAREQAA